MTIQGPLKGHLEALDKICRNKAHALKRFSYSELGIATGASARRVSVIVRVWEAQGLVKCIGRRNKNRLQYELTKKGDVELIKIADKPISRAQSPEQNMWTAMRMLDVFMPQDIAINASTETQEVTLEQARAFCRLLVRGDKPYLRVRQTAIPGKRDAAYKLIRNTGPKPPQERRIRATYDANLGEFTHLPDPTS